MITTVLTISGGLAIFIVLSVLLGVDDVLVCSSVFVFGLLLALAIICDTAITLWGAAA